MLKAPLATLVPPTKSDSTKTPSQVVVKSFLCSTKSLTNSSVMIPSFCTFGANISNFSRVVPQL
jgi:hypothetical protein